jgi:hypothetical protein
MTGHEELRNMRRRKLVPRAVWITDGEDVMARDWHEEPNLCDQQKHACISLAETDVPEALDFRCLIGLEVHVSGDRSAARARRIHNALIEAEAKRVITTIPSTGELLLHGVPTYG